MKHETEWADLVDLAALDLLKVPSNRHRIAVLEVNEEVKRLREYITHLETCSRCDEGFYQMCDERDELRRRAFTTSTEDR